MRILLVEDDFMVGESLADGLKGEGYAVDWVRDGRAATCAEAGCAAHIVNNLAAFLFAGQRKRKETYIGQDEAQRHNLGRLHPGIDQDLRRHERDAPYDADRSRHQMIPEILSFCHRLTKLINTLYYSHRWQAGLTL